METTGQSQTPAPDAARAWIHVDLGALVRNGARLARRAGVPLLPMVKADGYGLGAVPAARALERLDPWAFGVATVAEGRELRGAGIARRVLVFTPLLPADLAAARALELTPTLHRAADIAAWGSTGRPWHLAVDTGMNRAGVRWDRVGELADVLRRHPPEGAFTHFHSADLADGSRERQEARFRDALAALPARPAVLHAENSPALEHGDRSAWTVARPGVFLYGVESGGAVRAEPVVALRARIVDLRDVEEGETVSYAATWRAEGRRRIATLAVGYGDGYRRALSNRGTVLLHGRRAPVAGLVTMDMTMVDVTEIPCAVGDVATLIGADGGECLSVADVARTAQMLSYELLTGLRGRLPRLYGEVGA
ncbi:MAG TPA: alanine racemase [Gemmatimonadaceae bacterium]|nr:alanine racemase [Gemmatimonadaceae bacterium]